MRQCIFSFALGVFACMTFFNDPLAMVFMLVLSVAAMVTTIGYGFIFYSREMLTESRALIAVSLGFLIIMFSTVFIPAAAYWLLYMGGLEHSLKELAIWLS